MRPVQSSKYSEYIHRDDLFRAYEGIRFANYLGYTLNVELTVCWECEGYEGDEAVDAAFRMFIDRFKKFVRYQKSRPFYWAVFENGPSVGLHSHMALHVQDSWARDFRRWLTGALRKPDGTPLLTYSTRIHRGWHVNSQWPWFKYAFKGLNPALLPDEECQFPQGTTLNSLAGVRRDYTGAVSIKRVRIARSMLTKAQQEANYRMPPSLAGLPMNERYSDSEYRRGAADRLAAETMRALANLDTL